MLLLNIKSNKAQYSITLEEQNIPQRQSKTHTQIDQIIYSHQWQNAFVQIVIFKFLHCFISFMSTDVECTLVIAHCSHSRILRIRVTHVYMCHFTGIFVLLANATILFEYFHRENV